MTRDYSKFNLPRTIDPWMLSALQIFLMGNGMWFKLPEDLIAKLNRAITNSTSLTLTVEDLDEIDDSVFDELNALVPEGML